jgi:2-phosphoglycerate kinase
MIYLIGGPPRVGKSIVSRAIAKRRRVSAVSTDSLAAVLESVLGSGAEPRLHAIEGVGHRCSDVSEGGVAPSSTERMNRLLEECHAVWKAVRPFIGREDEEGRDVLIEGVAVIPALAAELVELDYRAVFIGNQGGDCQANIRQGAAANQHDWMRHASDECIAEFADLVSEMSVYLENEAQKHGLPYVEIGGIPFTDAASLVEDVLFS